MLLVKDSEKTIVKHHLFRKLPALVIVALMVGSLFFWVRHTSAAAGQMYISPGSTSVPVGSNFTVSVRINPAGGSVDSLTAIVNYDSAKLQFVSNNTAGSGLATTLAQSGGGGTVQLDQASFPPAAPVTADALVAQITFKALVGSGTASLNMGSGSNTLTLGVYNNPALSGATVTLTTPAPPVTPPPASGGGGSVPAPKPTTPSTSGGTSKPSTSQPSSPAPAPGQTTPSTPNAPAAPKTTCTGEARNVQFTSAVIHVACSQLVKVSIKYGLDGKILTALPPTGNLAAEFDIPLTKTAVLPGAKIAFSVSATDATNTVVETEVKSFSSKGYTIKVRAMDKDNKAIAGKNITLHSDPMTAKTDKDGWAVFGNVAPGQHKVEFKSGRKTYSQPIIVEDAVVTTTDGTQFASPQNFALAFAAGGSVSGIVAIVGVLVLAVIAFFFIMQNGGPLAFQRIRANVAHRVSGKGGSKSSLTMMTGDMMGPATTPTVPPQVIQPPTNPSPPDDNGSKTHVG
jgi:hypothetical protein